VLRLLALGAESATVSEEEVKLLLQEGMEAGVFHAASRRWWNPCWPSTAAR